MKWKIEKQKLHNLSNKEKTVEESNKQRLRYFGDYNKRFNVCVIRLLKRQDSEKTWGCKST